MRYTFGDTVTADERLKTIASFFNPLAREFILQHIDRKISSVVDLGCGPGYTTKMLAQATNANSVTGIDISDSFLDSARKKFENITFVRHDVRNTILPVKADLIYFRFLLSHLKNVRQLVEGWTLSLNPGGYLVIDELEDIYTENEFFKKYLAINEGLIESQGANLYIGRMLEKELRGLNIYKNVSSLIPVKNSQAAAWFYPNTISVWEEEEWVQTRLNESERKHISEQLYRMSLDKTEKSSITWRMRKMIIQSNNYHH